MASQASSSENGAIERSAAELNEGDERIRLVHQSTDAGPNAPHGATTSSLGDYLAGIHANNRRDLAAAADYMSRALRDDPHNPALQQQAFLLMASVGRMDEARELAQALLEHDGADPATVFMALEHARTGDLKAAAELVDRLPGRGLSSLMKPLLAGWIETARGDVDGGVEELEALAQANGFDLLRIVHTALMYDVAERGEAAAEAYGEAFERTPGLSLRLAWLVGNFYARQGERDKAVAIYQRYLAENPDSIVMDAMLRRMEGDEARPDAIVRTGVEGLAEVMFNVAGMLSQQGGEDVALIYAQVALHLRPEFEVADVLLGELLQSQGRSRDAIEVYKRIDPRSPFHHVARMRIAEELQKQERYEEAADLLESVAAELPHHYEPMQQLGSLMRVQERFAEAAEAYERAVARVEEPENRHWPLLYFQGIALERTDRWKEAEAALLEALALEPEQPYVMNYLAYSWIEQKAHLEKAQDMLVRAVELRPDDGYIVDSLGWVYFRLGHYDKAVKQLERAVELRPHDPVINDHLGDAYWKVGRRMEARFQWKRALGLDPESEEVPMIEAKLENGLEAARQSDG